MMNLNSNSRFQQWGLLKRFKGYKNGEIWRQEREASRDHGRSVTITDLLHQWGTWNQNLWRSTRRPLTKGGTPFSHQSPISHLHKNKFTIDMHDKASKRMKRGRFWFPGAFIFSWVMYELLKEIGNLIGLCLNMLTFWVSVH